VESITSALPLCDVYYVGVGQSDDGTRELISSIPSSKIVILDSYWDDSIREGGRVLSIETNKVFDQIPAEYDWCFYLQSDECLHENDYEKIRSAMRVNLEDKNIDGILFGYRHFYGQYNYVGSGRRWYAHEIRIVRNNKGIRSYKDAQGFRMANGEKLRVAASGAFIYHYGWVRSPKTQQVRQDNFHRMWHSDEWVRQKISGNEEFDYTEIDLLKHYTETHPAVMSGRISRADWKFEYDRSKARLPLKYRILHFIEQVTGRRLWENRNYLLVK
jgi:hypothetical protein